jgi:ArsR family transcriptional regulator
MVMREARRESSVKRSPLGENDTTTRSLSNDEPAASHGRSGPTADVVPLEELAAHARAASRFLKALSNPIRLRLLYLLGADEMTVSELESALGLRQPAISQQLARLRAEGLIAGRRDGKSVHYRLASEAARRIMLLLSELFDEPGSATMAQGETAPRIEAAAARSDVGDRGSNNRAV